jgi:hypothetical protein
LLKLHLMKNVQIRDPLYQFFKVKLEEFLVDSPQKTGLDMVKGITNTLTLTMKRHGYFLLIIKQNLKLNQEDLMLLPMDIIVIIYYQHLEAHGIYVLMKIVTNIMEVILNWVTLMNYHLD